MQKTLSLAFALVLGTGAGACADDLTAQPAPDRGPGGSEQTTPSATDGSPRQTRVNAGNATAWVYFSLASASMVEVADARASQTWDLGFQRFKVKSNGGESGGANAAVAPVAGAFDAVTRAPADGYITDVERDANGDSFPDLALLVAGGGWFSYDMMTHRLTARPQVFALRTGSGTYYKLQFDSYYDEAGSPGQISFRWARIDAPQ